MNDDDRNRLIEHFDLGLWELHVRDLQRSDEADVRIGTFVQAAAFVDALALAYSARRCPGCTRAATPASGRLRRGVFPARVRAAPEGSRRP